MSQSSITISGTIKEDAQQRFTPSNVSVVSFTMRVLRYDGRNKTEKAFPVRVNLWGEAGASQLDELKGGTRVLVSGRLQINKFNDNAGKPVSLAEVEATSVQLISALANVQASEVEALEGAAEMAPAAADSGMSEQQATEEIPF